MSNGKYKLSSSIISFFNVGILPGLGPQINISTIESVFGPAEYYEQSKTSTILRYGQAQFILKGSESVEFLVYFAIESATELKDFVIRPLDKNIGLYELIELFNDNSVYWEVDPSLSFGDQIALRTQGSVSIIFDLGFFELNKLYCKLQ